MTTKALGSNLLKSQNFSFLSFFSENVFLDYHFFAYFYLLTLQSMVFLAVEAIFSFFKFFRICFSNFQVYHLWFLNDFLFVFFSFLAFFSL